MRQFHGDAHFCPGCGMPQQPYTRYPWYFCSACLTAACDWSGRSLTFSNSSFSGGLSWTYADSPASSTDRHLHVVCLIKDRPVIVTEARFGGIVAQPLDEGFFYENRSGGIDLSREPDPHIVRQPLVFSLPKDWFTYIVPSDVDVDLPGIYEWHIEDVGIYIGRYSYITRPIQEYTKNVRNLLNEQPYRPANPFGFRHIHLKLAEAVRMNRKITLTILENVDVHRLHARERELIKERGTLNKTK